MARARNLKPGFFLNDELAEIEMAGRLLFAGLWTIADREGRLEDRPKKIKAAVFPYDDVNVDHLLQQLHNHKFIHRYEVNGDRFIFITNWHKHQNPHKNEVGSTIPEPTGENQEDSSNVPSESEDEPSEPENIGTTPALTLNSDSFNLIPDSSSSNSSDTAADDIDPFIPIMDTYMMLRGINSAFVNAKDRDYVHQVVNAGIPPDFAIAVMKEVAMRTEVNSMLYFLKVIKDRWKQHLEAIEGGKLVEINSRSSGKDRGSSETSSGTEYFDQFPGLIKSL